ncbi:MAG: 50S ribosomal protein L17 [Parcubacteria group bacterium]|nr:50S ribosomal protein L17 [Parcubacteria group bacterium]
MRHRKKGRTFHRKRAQRRALLTSLARGIIEHGRIMTTEAKAKEMRPYVEKLVTRAKGATVADRRVLARELGGDSVRKLVDDIAPRYQERHGGYLRIIKLGRRKSDGAPLARITFVE